MDKFKNKYRIESTRLKDWNYTSSGYYYVTICTRNHINYFGEIVCRDALYGVSVSRIGEIARKYVLEIPKYFSFIEIDKYIIMPNHIHGIVKINGNVCRDALYGVSLSNVIKWFKGRVTFEARKTDCYFGWQPRFYDHIIRDKKSLNNIRNYIQNNPTHWGQDPENINNIDLMTEMYDSETYNTETR